MTSVVFPFTITADQLNAADTADQTVLTLTTNSRVVRVPTRLEIYRASGTAYSLTGRYGPPEPEPRNSADNFHRGGKFLVIRSVYDAGEHSAPQDDLFYIPMGGLLDQTSAVKMLAMPLLDGKTFRPGASSFVLRSTCAIASGTGSLTCRLFFDEIALPEV